MYRDPMAQQMTALEAAALIEARNATREQRKYVPLEKFTQRTESLLTEFNPHGFRKLCLTAIESGLVSSQELTLKFGEAIPRKKLESEWAVPNPATCRDILNYLASLDPQTATGSILPWRHSQCAQPEAAPTLPGLQRTATARPHSRPS